MISTPTNSESYLIKVTDWHVRAITLLVYNVCCIMLLEEKRMIVLGLKLQGQICQFNREFSPRYMA